MGNTFTAAIKAGLTVDYEIFDDGFTTDIGTHEEMKEYLKKSLNNKQQELIRRVYMSYNIFPSYRNLVNYIPK